MNEQITVIQKLARTIQAAKNCEENGNGDWYVKHTAVIRQIESMLLPSGSGIDCGTKVLLDESSDKKIVLSMSYHHMNDAGFYDGWTEHKVIVTPSFNGIDMRITGRDRGGIKDYLFDVYYWNLLLTYKEAN